MASYVKQYQSNSSVQPVKENDCLKARQCMLTPYQKAQTANKFGKDKNSNVTNTQSNSPVKSADDLFGKMGNASTGGCCPGQTGHHLIPETWLKDCPAYTDSKHRAAPVVCAEGTGHSDGTHGTFHTKTDNATKKHLGKTLSMKGAIDIATGAHEEALEEDLGKPVWYDRDGLHCDRACIQAQLKAFYKTIKCDPVPKTKTGGTGGENTSGPGVE